MDIPRLSGSQRAILDLAKAWGEATIPRLAEALALNVETVRGHLKGLVEAGLAERVGSRSEGPGRPEIVYRLTAAAERLFPRLEPELLQGLAEYLRRTRHQGLLNDFFEEWMAERREAATSRVAGLAGRARLEEVAAILSELGFMAVVDDEPGAGEEPRLRLCHCPLRSLVDATRIPCRAEVGLVGELLGRELQRETYIPAGDAACSYRLGPAAGGRVERDAPADA